MKVSKRQLKRIIREEKRRLDELEEYRPNTDASGQPASAAEVSKQMAILHNAIGALFEVMEPHELAMELQGIADEMMEMYG